MARVRIMGGSYPDLLSAGVPIACCYGLHQLRIGEAPIRPTLATGLLNNRALNRAQDMAQDVHHHEHMHDRGISTSAPAPIRTACPYCGVGCGIVLGTEQGRPTLAGDPDHPGSHGKLCSKGRTLLHAALRTDTRLLYPELRRSRDEPRSRATWEEAITQVAARFRIIQAKHGRDAVALYVSGQCLTEEYYLANKLTKGFLGTNNIDTNSRLCMSSAVAGHKATLGSDCVPGCYEDIDLAETWLVTGANMAFAHPVLFRRIEAAKAADPGRRLIVIDPRRTDTAQVADLHLAIRPGSDVALHLALGHELLRLGAVDAAWIAAHSQGWDRLRPLLESWSPERAAVACDVPAADIRTAASWLHGRRWMSLWTMGLNQSSSGTDKVASLINLSLITGTVGRPGCGPFSLTGQPNAMGGREAGGLANLLPAHRSLAMAADRQAVEDFWGVPHGTIPPAPGLSAVELVEALRSGRCKAVWIIATNPVASLPAALHCDDALRAAELVVVQDAYHTDTLPFADVVLPAATWPEKTGAMTTSERRVHLVESARPPPGEARPDWRILQDVAIAMGFATGFSFPDESAVFAEHCASTRGTDCDMSGLSYAKLRRERSVQWPCPTPDHPGTKRLFANGVFPTTDGRCRLWADEPIDRSEQPDSTFPLVLTTGRIRDQWHTQTRSGLVAKLNRTEPSPFCELHPIDAAERGITDGMLIAVTSRRGSCRVRARPTDSVRQGLCFLPMHWGPLLGGADGRANVVTSDRLDPLSKEPDLKLAAVQVQRWTPAARRIVVVGAGAAALAFCRAHRTACPQDAITVLGEEPEAGYDRVQLPHLIAGDRGWSALERAFPDGVNVRTALRIASIDRDAHEVVAADGARLGYDHLVLATGSRPAMTVQGPGVCGLRNRADAERLAAHAGPGSPVVIIGAGLLGLELADALHQLGSPVTVLQRSERIMGKQLDATAAGHLTAILRQRGIDMRLNARVASVSPGAVTLEDGTTLSAAQIVVATGTEANDHLASAAGLACNRGILVDKRMSTADPAISAIGECACLQDDRTTHRVGTTPGATAQAEALSAMLAGDPSARWRPSPLPNLLKIHGVQLAAIGEVEERDGDDVVCLHDQRGRRYLKVVVRADRVAGVICLGDLGPWPQLLDLCQSGVELDELRDRLLAPGGSAGAVAGKLVCSCLQIGSDTIAQAAREHGGDIGRVCAATRAGTGCGSCRPEVGRICAASTAATTA
jgi:ferredoxin-nitrate reductase